MYGPRSCAWTTDKEYLQIFLAAERDGHIPPPRRAPPRPSHLLPRPPPSLYLLAVDRFLQEVPPPIPRRPAPPPTTPNAVIARRVVSVVLGRIWASNLIVIENLPGPAADLILSHFLY